MGYLFVNLYFFEDKDEINAKCYHSEYCFKTGIKWQIQSSLLKSFQTRRNEEFEHSSFKSKNLFVSATRRRDIKGCVCYIFASLLKNLRSKHNLLLKFGQFILYYKRKKIIKKFYRTCDLKTSSRSFCVFKELSTASIGKWNFWSKLIIFDI